MSDNYIDAVTAHFLVELCDFLFPGENINKLFLFYT